MQERIATEGLLDIHTPADDGIRQSEVLVFDIINKIRMTSLISDWEQETINWIKTTIIAGGLLGAAQLLGRRGKELTL